MDGKLKMRKYGEIQSVNYKFIKHCAFNQADEYKLVYQGHAHFVYVDTMAELKEEIGELLGGNL